MAFIPAENCVSVELRYSLFGENVENTLFFYNPDGVNLTNMATLAGEIDDWWDTQLRPLQSTAVTYRETYVTDLTSVTSPTYSSTVNAGLAGAKAASAGQPGSVTFCITFATAARGRSGRGRNYAVGLVEGDITGNLLVNTQADALVAAYEQLLTLFSFPYDWVVLSSYTGGAPRTERLVQPVQSVRYADLAIDSQRRRLAGRGN